MSLFHGKIKIKFTFSYRIIVFNIKIHYRRFFIVNRNMLKFLQIYAEFKTKAIYIFHSFMKHIFVKDNYYERCDKIASRLLKR